MPWQTIDKLRMPNVSFRNKQNLKFFLEGCWVFFLHDVRIGHYWQHTLTSFVPLSLTFSFIFLFGSNVPIWSKKDSRSFFESLDLIKVIFEAQESNKSPSFQFVAACFGYKTKIEISWWTALHRGSICASYPSVLGSIPGIPKVFLTFLRFINSAAA